MNTKYIHKAALALACAAGVTLSAASVFADSVIGGHDWDSASGTWTTEYGWATLSEETSGGNTGGWLKITFPATAEPVPPTEWQEIAHTSATNIFAGTWSTNQWVSFDFWASNATATKLQIQWKSSTNANIWGFTLTPPGTGTWETSARASLSDWTDWQYPGATADQFLSDLETMDWIGIFVQREGQGLEEYGLDNFNLMIPEPAEICLLLAAMIVLLLYYRRHRRRHDARTVPV